METILQKVFNELIYRKKVASQVDFGNKLEYKSEGYISNLLKSHGALPPKLQNKLHEVFGVSKVWLVTNGEKDSMFGGSEIDLSKPLAETFGANNVDGNRVSDGKQTGQGQRLRLFLKGEKIRVEDFAATMGYTRVWLQNLFNNETLPEDFVLRANDRLGKTDPALKEKFFNEVINIEKESLDSYPQNKTEGDLHLMNRILNHETTQKALADAVAACRDISQSNLIMARLLEQKYGAEEHPVKNRRAG